MKKILLLNGHLILKKGKTGVHVVHEELTKRIMKHDNSDLSIRSLFLTIGNHEEYKELIIDKKYSWIADKIKKISFLKSICLYFLPIELFCGRNNLYFCDGVVPYTLFSSKRIAVVHDLMSIVYPENYTFVQKVYAKLYFRRLKKADVILVESENTKNDLVNHLDIQIDCIKLIHLGCNINVSTEIVSTSESRIDYEKKYYFYIGDMRKNKNLENAIMGFKAYLDKTDNESYFYIAGSMKFEFPQLKKLVEELNLVDKVIFWGYVSDEEKTLLYKHCYALLFVSSYEGFGIPIIEAANFDKPFITSNTSSMRELGHGSTLLVNPMSVEDITNAMIKLDDKETYNKEKKLAQDLKDIYTWENCFSDTWKYFKL